MTIDNGMTFLQSNVLHKRNGSLYLMGIGIHTPSSSPQPRPSGVGYRVEWVSYMRKIESPTASCGLPDGCEQLNVNTQVAEKPKRINYRKLAFEQYDPVCAHCGFGIPAVLEVAHIDRNRHNNQVSNLVILCPNCHKMYDLDLISMEIIIQMRDRPKAVNWAVRMKDAGQKAALKRKWRLAGKKAAETRRRNQESKN
ncbi:MAG: hypothetical protein CO189_07015 [candidate division Zixibacteria bacterium CG_4_9_14_3_um_filter_46_8]|nr:MAG: hypothetical protein CO189_07015 [candidate division Zixibacteria bacterium CG_4_9_14_3_um_filter_46_8]